MTDQRKALEHELEENKRQLKAHEARTMPANEYDQKRHNNETMRLNLVINFYQQAVDELEDGS